MRNERERRFFGSVSLSLVWVSRKFREGRDKIKAHFAGLSIGWSVTSKYSKASPAFSTALMRSGVRS